MLPYYMNQQTRDMLIAESKRRVAERAEKRSAGAGQQKRGPGETSARGTKS